MSIYRVSLSKKAKRDLQKIPRHVVDKLLGWVDYITKHGILYSRRVPGYNDEALRGRRQGQRSIRLSKAYRAIYEINKQDEIYLIEVIEVNKHDY